MFWKTCYQRINASESMVYQLTLFKIRATAEFSGQQNQHVAARRDSFLILGNVGVRSLYNKDIFIDWGTVIL